MEKTLTNVRFQVNESKLWSSFQKKMFGLKLENNCLFPVQIIPIHLSGIRHWRKDNKEILMQSAISKQKHMNAVYILFSIYI